ncbi:conserved hypothetical protein (plasmid) [Acaryochloris marina MBIC11017]|uniref:Uncharacterized protein n=2 Tax=Acaryochloris marina TaxID=155978 RepID=A8ZNM6_ACAM1|nr:conserved hypothetical protein [Acaryochloris marina MBIC11017]
MALPLQVPGASTLPDLSTYDHILVAFSGGKDSICCLLRLLELGVPAYAYLFIGCAHWFIPVEFA